MILKKIFCSEFDYLISRISTRLYFIVLLAFTIGMKLLISTGDGVSPNNTFHITGMAIIGGLIWLLMGGSVAGEAAAKDVQMRIHPLIYTSPVKKINYLGGRFLAAYAVNAILILALPLGVYLSFYLPGLEYFSGMEEKELLPFRPMAYLNVYFLISLPTVFVATALQFSFATLSSRVMSSYMTSLLIAIFAQVIPLAVAKLFGNWDLAKLLDPIGLIGILTSELGTWTVAEKNTRLVTLEGMFLWNRVLWLFVSIGLLWFTYIHFSFTNPEKNSWSSRFKKRSKLRTEKAVESGIIRVTAISVPQVQRNFGLSTYFYQTITIAWASFKKIAKHPLGLTLVGLIVLVSAAFGDNIISELGIPLLPTTQQVLGYFTAPVGNIGSPWVIIPLLIMFFSGELIWQERDLAVSEITDAVPVPDWVIFLGKFFGIGLIIVVWMVFLMIGGLLMQSIIGTEKFELGLYLKMLFGLQLVDYLLFSLLAFVVHVVVNHKYIALLVVLMIFAFMAFPSKFGMEHTMLIYGEDPGWYYSDMRGFGTTLVPWFWFKTYWIGWALLLAVAAKLFWSRGREQGFIYRIQSAKIRFSGSTIWVTILGAGLILCFGGFIFYNTNVINDYKTNSEVTELQAEYERRYGRYRDNPKPQLTATKLKVELFPERQQAEIQATYTLVNKNSVAIDSIHIGIASGTEFGEVNFDRPAAGVVIDNELSHHIYALEKPLKPGDTLQLNFIVQYKQNGFQHSGTKPLVVENGTFFSNYDLLPAIGYQRSREINDEALRKKYKLTARSKIPSLYDKEALEKPFSTDQTTFEAIIGTAEDEVAVAPGSLVGDWTEIGRRYFHYKTNSPIGGEYRILSSDYAVKESNWNDVVIKIYHHPNHAMNIDRMLQSVKTSLEYFSERFGPYPFQNLTLIEGAGPGGGATADAGIIYYGEQYAIMNPDDGPNGFDLPYYIMAHEIAHQWWGVARLEPAYVEGAGVLIESLSVYSGMQVLEKTYGKDHLQKYVSFLHSSYAIPRSLASASLIQANETFLYYKKGGLAMYALSKYIGKEKVNTALRSLLEKHDSGELPLPTTLDLYKELEQVTPDSLSYLINDLFKENTYWRLKTNQFSSVQNKEGSWEVTIKVEAEKFVVDNRGVEKELPLKDWFQIGIYEDNQPLYLQMHRIRSGEQIIKLIVPRKPSAGGIDPNYLMIDVRLEDNIIQVDGS